MCLVTNTPIPTILDKDLVVYKVLYKWGNSIYSLYQDYRYDIGKIYHNEEIGIEPNNIMWQDIPKPSTEVAYRVIKWVVIVHIRLTFKTIIRISIYPYFCKPFANAFP